MRSIWFLVILVCASVLPAEFAVADTRAPQLTLERVFGSPNLSGPAPRALKLSPDGTLLTSLRPRADDRERYDLWATDTATGAERMLVDSTKFGGGELSEAEKMQRERARIGGLHGIVSYDWAADGKHLLVPVDGDLYLAARDGAVAPLKDTHGALNAVVSPKGSFVTFVRDQNLVSVPVAGGAARPLTTSGKGTVHWGEAEFVAQEEMDRRTGFWWSPDERHIAVERFDEAPVKVVTRAAIGADGTTVYDQRYPAAGTPNALVELHVIGTDGSGDVKVDLGAEPDIYLARVDWLPDGSALLVQRENRAQTQLDMLRVDPATGKSTLLFSEKSGPKSWINLSSAYKALRDGSLIWRSERDGFAHLYQFKDGAWTQLTSGSWVVTDLLGIDEARGRVYFSGTKDDVLEAQAYALDLAHPDVVTRLTERGWDNRAEMDDKATRLVVYRTKPDQPLQVYLADTAGKRLSWISENRLDATHPYFPYLAQHRPTQFGTLTADDGSVLHWQMITPPLVKGKRYPVFFEHYGGPGTGQEVYRGWQGALPQYLVSRGWIYFEIDNRGSYNRGKVFEDQIYRAMGGVEVADQLTAAKWLKTQPYIDPAKVAIYGWSYGGYMTLKMLSANPGVYAAGVAGAPVTKWELYDTHYTERYLGDPRNDPSVYAASDAIGGATAITDPLLLVHGMSDDNVIFENSTALMAKLQGAGRPFETMVYPGQTHRVAGPGISVHLWNTILSFLDRTVVNAAPPSKGRD